MVLGVGVSKGRRYGVAFGLGCALGCLSHTLLAVVGVSALIAASPLAFTALKVGGGLYLVWLGVQVWRAPAVGVELGTAVEPGQAAASGQSARSVTGGALAWQGALAALTNPKGVLFFAAFLPQFIDPGRSLWVQFTLMAATFAVVESITELVIASTAARVRPWLQRVGQRFNQVCGALFMLIGAALPLR